MYNLWKYTLYVESYPPIRSRLCYKILARLKLRRNISLVAWNNNRLIQFWGSIRWRLNTSLHWSHILRVSVSFYQLSNRCILLSWNHQVKLWFRALESEIVGSWSRNDHPVELVKRMNNCVCLGLKQGFTTYLY